MLCGVLGDFKHSLTMLCYTSGDKAAMQKVVNEHLHPLVHFLGDKNYLIGVLTYVDFIFFELLLLIDLCTGGVELDNHPTLRQFIARMQADGAKIPALPFNNKMAKLGATI